MSVLSQESRKAVQLAVDVAYKSRLGLSLEQIGSDLIELLELNCDLDAQEIEGLAVEISEGLKIQIRIQRRIRA
jgi:hypothetical protein